MSTADERTATGIRVTVLILSHRPGMVGDAERSVYNQTFYKAHPEQVQVLVQHSRALWYGKANELASIAQGDYLVWLCDDDLLHPRFLEELLKVVDVSDHVPDILYTDRVAFRHVWRRLFGVRVAVWLGVKFRLWGGRFTLRMLAKDARAAKSWNQPKGRPNKGYYWTAVPPSHFVNGHWLPMTMLIRREYWRALGGFNESVSHADTELWFRAAKRGGFFAYVPRILFWYRRSKWQFSQESPSLENAMREFSRSHFDEFGMAWEAARDLGEGAAFQIPKIPDRFRPEYKRIVSRGLTPKQAVRALRQLQDRQRRADPSAADRLERDAREVYRKEEEARLARWLPRR